MPREYIALPFPDYCKYTGEDWFFEESYFDKDKDVYFIPKERWIATK